MAARRDEPTRVAPHGAPGTRAICDSSIVPLGLRGPFLNALRVDQSDLKQALILGRPRDPANRPWPHRAVGFPQHEARLDGMSRGEPLCRRAVRGSRHAGRPHQ